MGEPVAGMSALDRIAIDAAEVESLLHGVKLLLVSPLRTSLCYTLVLSAPDCADHMILAIQIDSDGRCSTVPIDTQRVYDGAIEANSKLLLETLRGDADIGSVSTEGKLQGSMASQSLLIVLVEATARRYRLSR